MSKWTVPLAVGLAATAAAGFAFIGHAGAAARFGDTFTVVEKSGPLVDEATQAPPDFSKPTPPGDTIVFKSDLAQDGRTIGDARGECTSVFDTNYVCNVFFTIPGHGRLGLQVPFDVADPQGDYVVTGGTGQFAGRHGWAHFMTLGNGDEVHTIHLVG
jgi:hypothetical protein